MLTPAYRLTLGSKIVDTTDEPQASTLVDLTVSLAMDTPADGFTLVLGNVGSLRPQRDDEVEIELGYESDSTLTQVVAGSVTTVEAGLVKTRVAGVSGALLLLKTFVDQTFESKTAGAIVRDLAGRAGVEVAEAEDGSEFPAYVIDGRRSACHHLHDLADLCGFDLYIDPEGRLVFKRFVGGETAHVLEYGKHILELEILRTPALAGQVEAWGESPAPRRGDDAWPWLTTDFGGSKGTAGTDGGLLLLERPALRTRAAASLAAQAALTEIRRRTLRGRVVILGRPQVRLGQAIRLRGLADESLNTFYQVRSITHRLTKPGGFTTTIGFRSVET